MNYAEWKLLILTGVPVGGALIRWLLVRRQSSTAPRTFGVLRFVRWLMQTATANVRLAQLKQVEQSTRETLETTIIDFSACRTENNRLRVMIAKMQAADPSRTSGAASSTPPIASATVNLPTKRSRKVSLKSSASPLSRQSADQNPGSSG